MDAVVSGKIADFFSQFRQQKYKKGEILIRADDDPSGIFYLEEGVVKVYAISKKGDELVLNLYKPVAFFPMTWGINNSPNHYYYEAVVDISIRRAPRDAVIEFVKNNPDVLYDLMGRVYRGVDGMLMRMTYLMSGSANARLISEILIQAKRFGKKDGEKVLLAISEKDLASSAGMTRETVSREMKHLKDQGLVAFKKSTLVIRDMERLEEALSTDF